MNEYSRSKDSSVKQLSASFIGEKKRIEILRSGGELQRLTDNIISIAKAARTETQIGFNPLSVSGLSLKIVQEIFEDPAKQNLTIVGAGQMAISVIENFYDNGITKINAVNRSKKILTINDFLSIETTPLSQLGNIIQNTDILVTSINSPLPIIGKGLIEQAMKERKNKPMLETSYCLELKKVREVCIP